MLSRAVQDERGSGMWEEPLAWRGVGRGPQHVAGLIARQLLAVDIEEWEYVLVLHLTFRAGI